jgi:hypothetical protein
MQIMMTFGTFASLPNTFPVHSAYNDTKIMKFEKKILKMSNSAGEILKSGVFNFFGIFNGK